MVDLGKAGFDIGIEHPYRAPVYRHTDGFKGVVGRTLGTEPEA